MIRSIAVTAAQDTSAEAAQSHALAWAKLFGARLHAVAAWRPEQAGREAELPENSDALARQASEHFLKAALESGVTATAKLRGEGLNSALLAEARECDLLVIGWPPKVNGPHEQAAAKVPVRDELSLVRKAESSVLVVSRPPAVLTKILVNYKEGVEGKAALRLCGHIAERAKSSVDVLALHGDIVQAQVLVEMAEQYLRSFDVADLRQIPKKGVSASESTVLETARSAEADLIIIGSDPYGPMERLFGDDTAERIPLATHTPVLIAR
jgi:nucleotide-binding universal stress UspA family protein